MIDLEKMAKEHEQLFPKASLESQVWKMEEELKEYEEAEDGLQQRKERADILIVCAGLYIVNDNSFALLEDAFMNNKPVEVSINVGSQQLKGKALITEFPLSAVFNKEFKYNLRLLGTGALV